jgi:hypothetical protein
MDEAWDQAGLSLSDSAQLELTHHQHQAVEAKEGIGGIV